MVTALGNKVNAPLRHCQSPVICFIVGRGTVGFYLAEFNTAVRAGCSIVALIGNDYRWNAEVQIQIDNYGADRVYGCDLDATANYADAAKMTPRMILTPFPHWHLINPG